jgi:hypothetical protein
VTLSALLIGHPASLCNATAGKIRLSSVHLATLLHFMKTVSVPYLKFDVGPARHCYIKTITKLNVVTFSEAIGITVP